MNTPDAPDPRKVAEAALEAFVYVPLGLALEAKDLVPKLAQRGRNQVVLARLGARFAMQRAEAEAERLVKRMQASAGCGPDTAGATSGTAPAASTTVDTPATAESADAPSADAPSADAPSAEATAPAGERGAIVTAGAAPATAATAARDRTRSRATGTAVARAAEAPARPTRRTTARSAPAATVEPAPVPLAIPGYDTLSASQVIPRLDALRPDELEAVRRHEAGNRARRTILSRIAQLQT